MKLVAQVKLITTPEQAEWLKQTLETTNSAANYISGLAWEQKVFKQFSLHKISYHVTREKFPLTAQIVILCISKVADAYKTGKNSMRTFNPLGAISYDSRVLSYNLKTSTVSIWTVSGRKTIPFACGERQRELLGGQRGESDLCLVDGKFYLLPVCDIETPETKDVEGYLGVDLGIVLLASDSDGEEFSGQAVEKNRRIFANRRRNLQRNGSKAAKRKLKKLSGKQARFQKDVNHCISKHIAQKAQDTNRGIAMEDLSGIRERVTVRRKQRARLSNWAYFQLKTFIQYKALRRGVPVILVDPRYTSQTCSKCGCVDKANRKSQAVFLCVSCGHSAPADTNAAVNISAKADVIRPTVGRLNRTYKPSALADGN